MNSTTSKIRAIASQAADALKTKLIDAEDRIESALIEHLAAQQETDSSTPFSVSFSIKIQPSTNKIVYVLGFSQRYKDETEETLPDPDQPELFKDKEAEE